MRILLNCIFRLNWIGLKALSAPPGVLKRTLSSRGTVAMGFAMLPVFSVIAISFMDLGRVLVSPGGSPPRVRRLITVRNTRAVAGASPLKRANSQRRKA